MSDEKKEDIVVAKPEEDAEETWKDIDELLTEASATHFVKVKFRGKTIKIGWKDLTDEEIAAKTINMDQYKTLTKEEQNKALSDWLELDVLAKIKKAGRVEGCLNDNEITAEQWKKLPARVRLTITMDILETRDELMRNFL